MNTTVKNILIFSAGLIIGGLAGIQLVKDKYETIAEEEIESMRSYNRRKQKEEKEDPSVDGRTKEEKEYDKKIYDKITKEYAEEDAEIAALEAKEKEEAENEYNEYEKISADANRTDVPPPYVITIDEFSEENHYDKVNLYYYEGDDSLCDVDEDLMEDVRGILGDDPYSHFDDYNTLYVRNERLCMDFEVIRITGKYSEIVCGIID